MYLIEQNNTLKVMDGDGIETIHIFHGPETMQDVRDDIYQPFLVFESVSNFSRLHLVMALSEHEALETITDTEEYNDAELLGVETLSIDKFYKVEFDNYKHQQPASKADWTVNITAENVDQLKAIVKKEHNKNPFYLKWTEFN